MSQRSYIKGFCDRRAAADGLTRGDARERRRGRRGLAAEEAETGTAAAAAAMRHGQWAVDPWAFRMNVLTLLLSAALTLLVLQVHLERKERPSPLFSIIPPPK